MSEDRKHGATVEARIEYIADLMRTRKFRTGKTAKELMAEWGMSWSSITHYTAEASRRVLKEIADPSHVSVSVGVAIEKALQKAGDVLESAQDEETMLRAASTIGKIGKEWAEIAGAMAPKVVKVDAQVSGEATPASAAAAVREMFGASAPTPEVQKDDQFGESHGSPRDDDGAE